MSDEAIGIEAEVEVRNSLKAWLHLIENWNLINRMIKPLIILEILVFLLITQTYLSHVTSAHDFYLSDFISEIIQLDTF